MRYFGGKQRIAAQLAAIMQPEVSRRGSYVEPFVGGASVMTRIQSPHRIGSDANAALITMWRALDCGWRPPESVSEAEYQAVRRAVNLDDPLTAFVGFGVSFAGKWFGGYARGGAKRNYAANAASSLRNKLRGLSGVKWVAADYRSCPTPDKSVIYCDPPYAGTTQYGAVAAFSWDDFWEWGLSMHTRGHAVFVSEYSAPPTWAPCAALATRTDSRTRTGRAARVEKLFVPKGSAYEGVRYSEMGAQDESASR